jgi:hypothetical protein
VALGAGGVEQVGTLNETPARGRGRSAGQKQRRTVEGHLGRVEAGDLETPSDAPRGVRLLPYFDAYAYRVGRTLTITVEPSPC